MSERKRIGGPPGPHLPTEGMNAAINATTGDITASEATLLRAGGELTGSVADQLLPHRRNVGQVSEDIRFAVQTAQAQQRLEQAGTGRNDRPDILGPKGVFAATQIPSGVRQQLVQARESIKEAQLDEFLEAWVADDNTVEGKAYIDSLVGDKESQQDEYLREALDQISFLARCARERRFRTKEDARRAVYMMGGAIPLICYLHPLIALIHDDQAATLPILKAMNSPYYGYFISHDRYNPWFQIASDRGRMSQSSGASAAEVTAAETAASALVKRVCRVFLPCFHKLISGTTEYNTFTGASKMGISRNVTSLTDLDSRVNALWLMCSELVERSSDSETILHGFQQSMLTAPSYGAGNNAFALW